MTKIIATSDLHGHLPDIPECDVLIIAGDICPDRPGNYRADDKSEFQLGWLDASFTPWLEVQPAKHIVGIAGNHDFALEFYWEYAHRLPWTYLIDSGTEIDGIKFWGLPWVPNLQSWAFYGNDIQLETVYQSVPEGTDVVISHGPPMTFLDWTDHRSGGHVGAIQAVNMIERVQPKAYVCGHIHEGFGKDHLGNTDIYNVAYVDEHYIPRYTTVVLDGFE